MHIYTSIIVKINPQKLDGTEDMNKVMSSMFPEKFPLPQNFGPHTSAKLEQGYKYSI